MAKEQLKIELIAEAKQAVKNLKEYTDAAKKSVERTGKLTQVIKGYIGEIAAVYMAMRKVIKVVKDTTQAYMIQEASVIKLESALKATGKYTPQLSSEMQELAKDLQMVSIYGDEATLQASAMLQSLGQLSGEGLKKAIPLVMELATGMGMDLEMAASLVGKSLGSTTNALSRYGIVIDMSGTKSEKLAELTEQITEKFGGMSEAMGTTFQGRVAMIKNYFGDIKEIIGKMLLESAEPMMKWLLDFLKNSENIKIITKIVQGFGAVFTTVFGFIFRYLQTYVELIKGVVEDSKNLGKVFATVFNPKNWKPGRIKEELANLQWHFKDTAVKIAENWINYAGNTVEKWKKVFGKGVEETIKIADNQYKLLHEELEEGTEKLDIYAAAMARVNRQAQELERQTEKLKEAEKAQNEAVQSGIDGWKGYADSIKEGTDILRHSVKYGFSMILRAMSDVMFAQAALNWFNFPVAASLIAGAIAARIAASVVMTLQQGGYIQPLQTGGTAFGDRQPAMLERGEMVLPKEVVQQNAAQIGAMRGGETGGAITINLVLDGQVLSKYIYKSSKRGQTLIASKAVV